MRWLIRLHLLLVVLLMVTEAGADGLLLAPSAVLTQFSEPVQAAVVTVKADHTADVSLFISLREGSGEPRAITLFLPLQNVPKGFKAKEVSLKQFGKSELRPLDETLRSARKEWEESRDRVLATYLHAALFAGPFAHVFARAGPAGSPRHRMGRAVASAEPLPRPAQSVQTQHSRVDIYEALRPESLARLAQVPSLPPAVRETLPRYAGRPFALVKLQTLPGPKPAAAPRGGARRRDALHPGVWLRFPQQLVADGSGAYRYDFPLGTGQGWLQPIGMAQVYVVASDTLNVHVDFPGRRRSRCSTLLAAPRSEAQEAAANERQVHVATYLADNPGRDVAIRLQRGASEWVAERALWEKRVRTGQAVFTLLALGLWAAMFAAFVWRDGRQPRRFAGGMVWGWLAVQALLLLPLTGGLLHGWDSLSWWASRGQPGGSVPRWLVSLLSPSAGHITHIGLRPFVWLFPLAWGGVIWGAVKLPALRHWRRPCWALPLAALLAGLLYLILGSPIALRLSHWLD